MGVQYKSAQRVADQLTTPKRWSKWRSRRAFQGSGHHRPDDWNGAWGQVDGDAEMLDMPEAADGLVDYFRCISGEHPRRGV